MHTANPFAARAVLLSAAVAAAISAPGALAQRTGTLEEVVVTAAKREQTLQEIPVAVSVVSAESMAQAQVLDIKDLQTLVPSLRVTQLQGSAQTNFIIRGFGNGANNAGIEPSVGVFIDGVYRSRVGSALADLPKLERVEVLRGPQSTLFGKNASAGVINVVTAKPDLTGYSASVGATVGNYNQSILRGDVTGPLSDNVAFSLFGSVNQRDGYFENIGLTEDSNELDRWNFRAQLLWAPSDSLEIRFIADAEDIDEVCCGVANIQDGPTGAIIRALGGDVIGNEAFAYRNFLDFAPGNENETRGASVQVDWEFDTMALTSITAYRTLDQFSFGDIDYTSARLVTPEGGNLNETKIDTFTQEIRLTSTGDGPLQWMVGAFFFNEEVDMDGAFGWGDQFRPYAEALTAALGVPGVLGQLEAGLGLPAGTFFGVNQGFPSERFTLDDDTLSLFAQADYDVSDALTLTVGLNYTESEKEASGILQSTDAFAALPLAQINPALAGLSALQFLPPFLNFPNSVEPGESSDDEITYTVRLSYAVNESFSVYGGVSTGFKASSWNLSRDSRPFPADIAALTAAGLSVPNIRPGSRFAGPEESTVYELGLKGEWATVSLNLALFNQEIEGFQQNAFTGTGFNLTNAGKQSTDGLEVDLLWAPTDNLRIAFAATWLDPLYDSFVGGVGLGGVPADLSGQRPAGIPELATNTNLTYNFQIGSVNSYVRVEHLYEDEVQVVDQIPKSLASREINTINASAGMMFGNGIELNLWGRNLNEDEYLLSAFPSVGQQGSFSAYPNQPRTYGLTLSYNFE